MIKKYMELVKFSHTIFSIPFILIAMVVAANGWFGWKLFVLGILAAVSARNFAMAVNRYLDRDIDAKNPRTADRPSVTGEVNESEMLIFIAANALIFIGVAYMINDLAFKLSIPILAVLGGYSYFKRFSEYAHLVLGVALGLAPIAGAIAVTGTIPCWSVFLALGVMFWVAGFDILYSLQDMEFDKKEGLHSIPALTGEKGALFISEMFHVFAVIFWALFVAYANLGFFAWLAVVVGAVMLYYEHKLVKKDFKNIPKAFFDVNGFLGIIFLVLIILDRI
ncbi:menaquinone biosynthesis prenyltransferase MqnP [Caminibacter pacificus]|jgi:4-hydroxybenzoate polyprenyltransferase|uniref:4-hydroxybenzoate polyprenyltransferase n=1 Tax=Caminibacter pacificus TaxID=1424653 RepID=A0AAJ4RC40_9BACT|nr:menaquinone biosynthesis prenyltransferase MqnP [Caminibacter pacificus]NPA88301.1 4-hydroxybenzoate polyprenyltransferase [Campylobacterota bacterium]QCI28860.1 4-hydroxybenzoate polyprenyltransferase [Caminibacter pacificus]ROR39451.1 4-hydroxybenzoate polyprenyltransferase [Caminibacter pacificus]